MCLIWLFYQYLHTKNNNFALDWSSSRQPCWFTFYQWRAEKFGSWCIWQSCHVLFRMSLMNSRKVGWWCIWQSWIVRWPCSWCHWWRAEKFGSWCTWQSWIAHCFLFRMSLMKSRKVWPMMHFIVLPCPLVLFRMSLMKSRKVWLMMHFTVLWCPLVLFRMSLIQTAGHNMTALTVVFLWLPNTDY